MCLVLDGINTEAAEQLFSWLKGYASILSCLGWRRSPLLLLILFHNKNLERTSVRPSRTFDIVSHVSCIIGRNVPCPFQIGRVPRVTNVSLAHAADEAVRCEMAGASVQCVAMVTSHPLSLPQQIDPVTSISLHVSYLLPLRSLGSKIVRFKSRRRQ